MSTPSRLLSLCLLFCVIGGLSAQARIFFPDATSIKVNLSFDEGTGTSAASVPANTFTLSSASWSTTGNYFGNATTVRSDKSGGTGLSSTAPWFIGGWFNITDATTTQYLWHLRGDMDSKVYIGSGNINFFTYSGTSDTFTVGGITTGEHLIIVQLNGTHKTVWIDNVSTSQAYTSTIGGGGAYNDAIGCEYGDTTCFSGKTDEFFAFSRKTNQSEVQTIYNMRVFDTPGLALTVTNAKNNSLISSFSWNYTTTNASDSTGKKGYCSGTTCFITSFTASQMNFTVFNISANTYFNTTLSYDFNVNTFPNSTANAQTSQAFLNVTAYTAYYNSSISTFNTTNDKAFNTTTTLSLLIPAIVGTNTIKVDVAGNTSRNYSVNVSQVLTIVQFAATDIYDSILNSSGGGAPVLSALNCTSCNVPFGDNESPYVTSDTTPTFKFSTNINANCRASDENVNYTTMGDTRNCTSGEGLTKHTCTLTSQDAFSGESGTMYIACKNTIDGNESQLSSSGALAIDGVAATAQAAIDYGIHHSAVWPGATVYQNQQVYLRDINNNQKLATVDRVVVYGNQRWLFNYNNYTSFGLFNISPVVYVLEMANISFLHVEGNVTALINGTKT